MRSILATLPIALLLTLSQPAAALPSHLSGKSALGSSDVDVSAEGRKGLVVVFLSAVCPCSNSHLNELKRLKQEYPDFSFVGVHSNADEAKELTVDYFKKADLPFPVIQDTGTKIADEFKALKTPHVFVVLKDGSTAYKGGVSSSREFDNADRKYLREALSDLVAGQKVRTPEGRTLGCAISRGEKHAW